MQEPEFIEIKIECGKDRWGELGNKMRASLVMVWIEQVSQRLTFWSIWSPVGGVGGADLGGCGAFRGADQLHGVNHCVWEGWTL